MVLNMEANNSGKYCFRVQATLFQMVLNMEANNSGKYWFRVQATLFQMVLMNMEANKWFSQHNTKNK